MNLLRFATPPEIEQARTPLQKLAAEARVVALFGTIEGVMLTVGGVYKPEVAFAGGVAVSATAQVIKRYAIRPQLFGLANSKR